MKSDTVCPARSGPARWSGSAHLSWRAAARRCPAPRQDSPTGEPHSRDGPSPRSSHGRLEERRPVAAALLLLHFDIGDEQRGRNGRYRNAARLGAADAVEYLGMVGGSHDLRKTGQGRSHDIHSAHQLVGAAIGIYAVDHLRNDGERLQAAATGLGTTACDVAEVQPVWLVLPLDLVDEHFPQLAVAYALR